MRRIVSILAALSMVWSAGAEGVLLTFDPPRKIEVVKAWMKEGKLGVVIAGTAGEKEFSRVVLLTTDTKRIHSYSEADTISSFPVIPLGKLPPVQSIAFAWQGEKVTAHVSSGDRSMRIDFEKGSETGVLKPVDARDLQATKAFPRIKITNQIPRSALLEAPEKAD